MCRHHYMINSKITNGWSLARCKWCLSVEAFKNYYDITKHGQMVPPSSAEKRDFLHSQGIRVTKRHWSIEEQEQIIMSVSRIGITATAKKFNVPSSTVGLWAKGKSPKAYRGKMYNNDFKKKVAQHAESTNNNRKTAKIFNVARGSVQRWRKQYCFK